MCSPEAPVTTPTYSLIKTRLGWIKYNGHKLVVKLITGDTVVGFVRKFDDQTVSIIDHPDSDLFDDRYINYSGIVEISAEKA
jgi:hypothetical protein